MFFGIIKSLGDMYQVISQARGRCTNRDIKRIADGALALADNAEKICLLAAAARPGEEDLRDLDEIKLMRDHIEEMMVFQLSQEIV